MEIQISPNFAPESALLRLKGALSARYAETLEETVRTLLVHHRHLIFDCSELNLLDSTGLGALVRCLRAVASGRGRLSLVNLQHGPRMVLELTRTNQLFDIYDNVAGALQEPAAPCA